MPSPMYPPGAAAGDVNGNPGGNSYQSSIPLDPSLISHRSDLLNQPHLAHLPPPYVIPHHYQNQGGQSYPAPQQYPPTHSQQYRHTQESEEENLGSRDSKAGKGSTGSAAGPSKQGRPSKKSNSSEDINRSDTNYPAIMVYPPPPPPPGERYNPSPLFSIQPENRTRDDVNLPSVGSWAPTPGSTSRSTPHRAYSGHYTAAAGWESAAPRPRPPMPADESWAQQGSFESNSTDVSRSIKRERDSEQNSARPLSDPGEVEASLALAALKRRDSSPTGKKVKKEKVKEKENNPNTVKKSEKDGRKSCAECRRLKAKCDRVFPCANCRRRGCALVCPDGDLSCMQGKRLVLASTEQLHERIAQLESALFQSHGKTAKGHHPLLAPEYLDGGFASLPPPQLHQSPVNHSPQSGSNSNGELSRSPKGPSSASSLILVTPQLSADRSSSQGRMAVESLLLTEDAAAPEGKREDEWAGENAAPAMIIGTVGNSNTDDLDERHQVFERLKKIMRVLPPREEVQRRAMHFWETSVWYQTALRAEEFDTIYEPAVYAPTPANPLSPHKLAVVLIVLTLDCYLDMSLNEEDPLVAEYWDGVQRCFDTRFGWAASVAGVQALAMATLFVGFGWRGARASNFYWLRQMTSAAMQLGLHRDPHPSLPEEEREFRRRVFHEVFVLDCLICLNHGQRTSIPIEYIEAAYPKNTSPLSLKKYEFMKLVKTQVIDIGCLPDSAPASWEKVEQVKERLMQFDVSNLPLVHCPLLRGEAPPSPVEGFTAQDALALQTTTTSMCHYKAMLYLFRPALRRLVARLRSQPQEQIVFDDADRECVSMTYRACHAITLTSYYMARKHPMLMGRCWMVWIQTFSAAVSMAALAIWCGPHLENSFVKSAYQELCEACDMIGENGSTRSLGVLSLLPILKALVSNRYPQVAGKTTNEGSISHEGEDMLFALLGGHVDGRDTASASHSRMTTPPSMAQLGSANGNPNDNMTAIGNANGLANGNVNNGVVNGSGNSNGGQPEFQQSGYRTPPHAYMGSDGNQTIPFQAPMVNPNAAAEAYAVGPYAQPNTGWYLPFPVNNTDDVVLPLAQCAPSASPFTAAFPGVSGANSGGPGARPDQQQQQQNSSQSQSQCQNQNQGQGQNGNGNQDQGQNQPMNFVENPTELWARLQTFYEPSPMFWGTTDLGVGMGTGVGPGVGMVGGSGQGQSQGFVDYSGPMY